MKHSPPGFFHRFFRWYCHPKHRDYIEGDLMEVYEKRLERLGKRGADRKFIIDVLLLFRPGIIKPFRGYKNLNTSGMYKSYFKVGWRNLTRHKAFSFINVGGLALGMTVAMFIGLWIYDELSFDKYHQHYDRIAKVWQGGIDQQTHAIDGGYGLQYPVGATLKNHYGQYFEQVLMAWWITDFTLSVDDKKFARTGEFIDAGGPEMLSLKMLSGSYRSLYDPQSIILSKSLAKTMFGDDDPVNKTLRIDNKVEAKVAGVYEDIPPNNTFSKVQFFAPWPLLKMLQPWVNNRDDDWDNHFVNTYVRLRPNVTVEEANAGIHNLYADHIPPDYYKTIASDEPFVQVVPMSTWHLYSEFSNGHPATGRIVFVWLFGIAGAFVLLLACINFVNLSTARSERRAREVGVRKTMGSMNGQLVMQFLSESFMVVLLAFFLSLVFLTLFQQAFNDLVDKRIALPLGNPWFWLMAAGFILVTAFMAGLYPAFYLSSFKPVKVLKGVIHTDQFAAVPRKALVVIQFTVSVVLIIGTLVVFKQVQFARNRPVGYSRQGLIEVSLNDPAYASKLDVLKTGLLNSGAVSGVATSFSAVTRINNITGGYTWQGKDPDLDAQFVNCEVSPEFGKTIGWEIVAGRDFSPDIAADTISSIIINEAAAKYMGMTDPVGQTFTDVDEFGNFQWSKTIIGVVRDIVMASPYEPVYQTIFHYGGNARGVMHIRLHPAISAGEALPRIKAVFDGVVPSALFDYKFADEEYAMKFGQEERIGKLSGIFSTLAVLISCLGLFGLVSYVAEQRTKEIGIRKVVGASVFAIWKMLSKDFVILVIVSSALAIPFSYFLMERWLLKYEYRTDISWWIFAATAAGAVIITLLTVSYQALKAALMNPVQSLRSE
ncbi:MAG TPA: FtsX-like permease family protein [Chryseosolibacter sp.]